MPMLIDDKGANLNIYTPESVKSKFYRVLRIYQTKHPHAKVSDFLSDAVDALEEKLQERYPL